MVTVNNYQILLKEADWIQLTEELGDNFGDIVFESAEDKNKILPMHDGSYSVEHWKNEFNLKIISISINHAYMYTYYKQLDGFDIYQGKDKEKMAYHFWFSYEAESLLARLFTLVDNLYHILNVHYHLEVPEELGFRGRVVRALANENQDLSDYLSNLRNDQRYKDAEKIRNDFTHNHSPLNMTSGYKKTENGASFEKGDYLKPEEAVKLIDEFIGLLEELTTECKKYV